MVRISFSFPQVKCTGWDFIHIRPGHIITPIEEYRIGISAGGNANVQRIHVPCSQVNVVSQRKGGVCFEQVAPHQLVLVQKRNFPPIRETSIINISRHSVSFIG